MTNNLKYIDKVHESIASAIRNYPMLYNCRTDVLHHMFCIAGNGYYWKNGDLVCDSEREFSTAEEMIEHYHSLQNSYSDDVNDILIKYQLPNTVTKQILSDVILTYKFNNAYQLALCKWERNIYAETFKRIDSTKIEDLYFSPSSIYPLDNEFNSFNDIPTNANPEWIDAAYEIIFQLFDIDKSYHGTSFKNNINVANTSLKKLIQRFNKLPNTGIQSYEEYVRVKST